MSQTRFPIVGSSYRPPATEILAVLPVGTPLILRPEPDNPHDPHAKAVWIKTADISNEAFAALDDGRLRRHNLTIRDLAFQDEWILGYIPASFASGFAVPSDVSGTFSVGSNGGPRITVEL